MSYEYSEYQGVGAVDAGSTAKGWLYVAGILGVAVFAMKYLGPGRRKRKNPKSGRALRRARRSITVARHVSKRPWVLACGRDVRRFKTKAGARAAKAKLPAARRKKARVYIARLRKRK